MGFGDIKEGEVFICKKDFMYTTLDNSKVLIFSKNSKYTVYSPTESMLYFYCKNIINADEAEHFGVKEDELSVYFMGLKDFRKLKIESINKRDYGV